LRAAADLVGLAVHRLALVIDMDVLAEP